MTIALRRLFILTIVFAAGLAAAVERRPAWTTSNIKGTPYPPAPYAIRPAFPNLRFELPTSLEELPDGRMLVSEIGGAIYTFAKDEDARRGDLLLEIEGEPKVWHATAHPKFKSNGQLFVCYSNEGTSHVSRFQVNGVPPKADPKSEQVLLTWPAGGHNAGCLRFGTDGMLYISTGDGSGPNPPDGLTAAQDVSNLFGCVLRIDVDQRTNEKAYSVPKDNPFIGMKDARPEIWAYGLRNPWKFGVDSKTGKIFAADNGWESWEMVHQIVRGGNCGWPIMEGRAVLRSEVKQGPTPIRPPVKDHSHTEANSVIGGPVYRGSKLKELDGTFIYGDYITGTIWGINTDGASYSHQTLVDTDQRITAFAEGSDGELFVVDYDYTGMIYEIVPSNLEDHSADFPRRLSETGLFSSLEQLKPASGVIPYAVNAPRWADGFKSKRFVAIPGTDSISLADGETPAKYPDGTVFVKHLDRPRTSASSSRDIPAETQILHYENGTWHPYTYVWNNLYNNEPYDATLVDSAGTDRQVVYGIDESGNFMGPNWHYCAENECRMCHNAGSGFVLGFTPNQLSRSYLGPPSRTVVDQLETLAVEKTISAMPTFREENPGRLVDPRDHRYSLDDRARSYLHGNCSSCHHPRGNAIVSFYLRRELPFEKLNTNKGTGIGTFGMDNAKIIVPGDPYRSVLLYRMSKLGYGRMPYIGSRVVDRRGVALIEKWIRAMPHTESDKDSAPVRSETAEAQALSKLSIADRPLIYFKRKPASVLLESTEGALALTSAIHAGKVSPVGVRRVYENTNSDIRGLFETFVAPSFRRKTLGRDIDPQTILSLEGSFDRGRLIFFSDGARCRNCHDVDNVAKSVGPTLAEIRKKYKRRSEVLQHILKPSLKVDEKFTTWAIATVEGNIHTGLIASQTDNDIVLKTANRKIVRIDKSNIDEMKKSSKSLMPEAILSDLTAQEAADLLQWFESTK